MLEASRFLECLRVKPDVKLKLYRAMVAERQTGKKLHDTKYARR